MFVFKKVVSVLFFSFLLSFSACWAKSLDYIDIFNRDNNFDFYVNPGLDVKKTYRNSDIILTVKNAKPSDKFFIKYNSTDFDNIVVKPLKHDTKIVIKPKKNIIPENQNDPLIPVFATLFAAIVLFKLPKAFNKNTEKDNLIDYRVNSYKNLDYILQHKLIQKNKEIESKNKSKFKIAV